MKPVSAGLSWAVCVGSLARLSRCGYEHQIRQDGSADIVLAYNWRLLEAITEAEKRLQRLGDERRAGTRQTARTGGNWEEVWRMFHFGYIDDAL
ncbi:hypothetical protein F5883DRAFT_31780 [Diaporthe sp. PMI_573]|nr:hypothetical protein F5883DRAFT_31780 [Diaporthaceae sp. PMI_573]